jgi:hypothetical protein
MGRGTQLSTCDDCLLDLPADQFTARASFCLACAHACAEQWRARQPEVRRDAKPPVRSGAQNPGVGRGNAPRPTLTQEEIEHYRRALNVKPRWGRKQ